MYLIKYYNIQKSFYLKSLFWVISLLQFAVLHLIMTPSCLFKNFKSSDVIVVKKKNLSEV